MVPYRFQCFEAKKEGIGLGWSPIVLRAFAEFVNPKAPRILPKTTHDFVGYSNDQESRSRRLLILCAAG